MLVSGSSVSEWSGPKKKKDSISGGGGGGGFGEETQEISEEKKKEIMEREKVPYEFLLGISIVGCNKQFSCLLTYSH